MADTDERVQVSMTKRTLAVTITIGEVVIAIKLPTPTELTGATPEAVRALAMRHARRILEVAREEVA